MSNAFGDRTGLAVEVADRLAKQITDGLKDAIKCCVNCEYFDEEKETCKQFGQRPPARVIAFGCEAFSDIIPF